MFWKNKEESKVVQFVVSTGSLVTSCVPGWLTVLPEQETRGLARRRLWGSLPRAVVLEGSGGRFPLCVSNSDRRLCLDLFVTRLV